MKVAGVYYLKFLLLPILTSFACAAFAQKIVRTEKVTDNSVHVIGNNFEGAIFSRKDLSGILLMKGGERFTPTESDILSAEKSIGHWLDTMKITNYESVLIKRKFKKYLRQYFGYVNERGERILSINFLWNSADIKSEKQWLKEYVEVSDGGYHYWRVKVNLDKIQIFDFYVNGEA